MSEYPYDFCSVSDYFCGLVPALTSVLLPLRFYVSGSDAEQPERLQVLSMEELIPGLQPLLLWMANSIELLHFIQHEVPQLLPWRQDQQDTGAGRRGALLSVGVMVTGVGAFVNACPCVFRQVCWTLRCPPLAQLVKKP